MTKEFEEHLREIHEKYGRMSVEQRRQALGQIKHRNIFAYHKLERIKHDLLRMETRRAQLELEDDPKQLADLEAKILGRKELFLKLLNHVEKKE